MKNTFVVMLFVLALSLSLSAQSSKCLIVRSAEGHRFRNSMIAGALTGGVGFVAGAAFSGAKYEYADSFNFDGTKPKYSGKDLEKLQGQGVHVIVVNKKTAGAEMESARNSCKSSGTPEPQAVQSAAPVSAAQAVQAPVSMPASPNRSPCLASAIDTNGNAVCTKYAQQ